jgi:hypothetical protein
VTATATKTTMVLRTDVVVQTRTESDSWIVSTEVWRLTVMGKGRTPGAEFSDSRGKGGS